MTEPPKVPEQPPAVPKKTYHEGVELSDDDLQYVVGGLDPEAVKSQVRFLNRLFWGKDD